MKSAKGVYAGLADPSCFMNLLLTDQEVNMRQDTMTTATKAIHAPTMMKTKFSGRLFFCMYGAFEVGGTEGGG